jgi:hypothetical protein
MCLQPGELGPAGEGHSQENITTLYMKFNMAVLRAYVRQYCTRMHAYSIQQAKHTPEIDEIAKEEIIKAFHICISVIFAELLTALTTKS